MVAAVRAQARPNLHVFTRDHALAAIVGGDRFRAPATRIFATGSFWCGAVPMAAAIATLTELRRVDGAAGGTRLLHSDRA